MQNNNKDTQNDICVSVLLSCLRVGMMGGLLNAYEQTTKLLLRYKRRQLLKCFNELIRVWNKIHISCTKKEVDYQCCHHKSRMK